MFHEVLLPAAIVAIIMSLAFIKFSTKIVMAKAKNIQKFQILAELGLGKWSLGDLNKLDDNAFWRLVYLIRVMKEPLRAMGEGQIQGMDAGFQAWAEQFEKMQKQLQTPLTEERR